MCKRWLLKTIIWCLLLATSLHTSNAASNLAGIIITFDGTPIEGAYVAPVTTFVGTPVTTDSSGRFSISLSPSVKYLIAYYNNNNTPGWDYVPAKISLEEVAKGNITVKLHPAASISLTWELQYVESEKLAEDVTITVLSQNGEAASPSGLSLIYEKYPRYEKYSLTQLHIPGLDPSTIIVPIGMPTIKVWSVVSKYITKTFTFQPQQPLQQGEQAEYDIRQFTIPENQQYVEEYLLQVKQNYTSLQENGFYLAKERKEILTSETQTTEAKTLYMNGDLDTSYSNLRKAYITLRQIKQTLQTLQEDASQSIYIILGFLALSSVIAGSMLAESNSLKILFSTLTFTASAATTYIIYPGSKIASTNLYTITAIASLTASIILSFSIEYMLARVRSGSKVSLRAVTLPVFSIAKRFLKRRRTRFIFTAASVTLLVTSFVVLTSVSEEYGVTLSRAWGTIGNGYGVMVSMVQPAAQEISFLSLMNDELNWFSRLPGIDTVSLKYVNKPKLTPLTYASSTSAVSAVYGVIGVDSVNEAKVMKLGEALLTGTLPKPGEAAVSNRLCKLLSLEVGGGFTAFGSRLTLSGVLDDQKLREMKEFDGDSYLPQKLVDVGSEGEPKHVLQACDAGETIIVDISTALRVKDIGLYRIGLGAKPGTDVDVLAERVALEMGYRASAASQHGSTTYILGTYIAGKGLPLVIPWSIVVLNVVTTMINSLYERRKEINIMSSVGLNPSHIAGVFISEASIIGFTAGGLGYLLGLSLYRLLPVLGFALEVQQKVSAFWSLASVMIALSAALVGVSVALRSSVVITPSLLRRWVMSFDREQDKPFETVIPVRFSKALMGEFTGFAMKYLESIQDNPTRKTSFIRLKESPGRNMITFGYSNMPPAAFYTGNTLIVESADGVECGVRLEVRGDAVHAYEVASLVRQLAMEWSNREKKP